MLGIDAFEQYASEYDAWFERNQIAYEIAYEAERRAIRAVLPSSGVGLEIGVGTGRFAAPLGIRIGIDPSPAVAAIARARGIEVTIGRAEALPIATGRFDYALMVATICFVDDLGAAFRESARVLNPKRSIRRWAVTLLWLAVTTSPLWAQGPPYETDDPVPVEFHHYVQKSFVSQLIPGWP
jgi:SAM-dependent methyltransferase